MKKLEQTVPNLRFKGFTDDWEQRELGEVAKVTMGQSPSSKNYTDNPNDYVLVQGNADLKSNEISPRVWTKEVTKQVHKGEFIMTVRAPVGYLATANMDAVIGRGVAAIDGNKYLYYLLQTKLLDRTWEKLSSGSTFESISSNDIKNLEIKVTETEEEKLIAKLMDTVTYFVTLQQRKLDLLKQLKKGLLQKMFADKDSKQPILRFKRFHDDWEQRKLGDLFVYNRPDKYMVQDTNYINSGTPVLTANKSFVLGYTNENHTYNKLPAIIFDDFTLENKFVNFPFMVKSSAIKILNSRNDQPMMFMYQLLQHSRFVHEGHSRHYISIVQRKDVMVPDNVEEQKKIATLFSRIQNIIAFQHQKLAKYQSVKKSLLQQMFI